jgi:hypothetical protein
MRLTLLSTGQQIDWNAKTHSGRSVQATGRERFLISQEKSNADRGLGPRPNITISADPDREETMAKVQREALPAAGSGATFRPLPEDVARRVIAALGLDAMEVGLAQTAARRALTRVALDRWNAEQQRRPGPKSPADYQQFEADIASALAVAFLNDRG